MEVDICGSPSKELHIVREPSFHSKKRVPGMSPERVKSKVKSLNSLFSAKMLYLRSEADSDFKTP